MKLLTFISLLSLSANSFAADYLLKFNYGSGFSPVKIGTELTVSETGKVVKTKWYGNTKETKLVKTLSPNTIQAIKDDITSIKSNAKLVDLDANKPRCMDAPSKTYRLMKEDKEVVFALYSGCHKSLIKSKAAEKLVQVIDALNSIEK